MDYEKAYRDLREGVWEQLRVHEHDDAPETDAALVEQVARVHADRDALRVAERLRPCVEGVLSERVAELAALRARHTALVAAIRAAGHAADEAAAAITAERMGRRIGDPDALAERAVAARRAVDALLRAEEGGDA